MRTTTPARDVIWAAQRLALAVPLLRPVCFLLAVPFLLLGYFANAISPVQNRSDAGPYLFKCDLVEVFPYFYSLMRTDRTLNQVVSQTAYQQSRLDMRQRRD